MTIVPLSDVIYFKNVKNKDKVLLPYIVQHIK